MKGIAQFVFVLAISVAHSASAGSHDLTGRWDLKIEDKRHHAVATLVVEFTSQHAQSCLGGNWMRLTVVSAATKDDKFFPVSDALSFEVKKNELTIGRNEVCDAYLILSGKLGSNVITGKYYGLGLGGSSPLGFFTLSREASGK